jgi:hypothetical protein
VPTTESASFKDPAGRLTLIGRQIDLLEQQRVRAEEGLFAALGHDYRMGRITKEQLVDVYRSVRPYLSNGFSVRWEERIPVPFRWIQGAAKLANMSRMNGPNGASWTGVWPPERNAPAPLAGTPVVYVLYDAAGEPIYLGSSKNLRNRLKVHSRERDFAAWIAVPCASREAAFLTEDYHLRTRPPSQNKKPSR